MRAHSLLHGSSSRLHSTAGPILLEAGSVHIGRSPDWKAIVRPGNTPAYQDIRIWSFLERVLTQRAVPPLLTGGGKTWRDEQEVHLAFPAKSDCVGSRGPLNLNVHLSRATCSPGACCGAAGVGPRVVPIVSVLLPRLQQGQHSVSHGGESQQSLACLCLATSLRATVTTWGMHGSEDADLLKYIMQGNCIE